MNPPKPMSPKLARFYNSKWMELRDAIRDLNGSQFAYKTPAHVAALLEKQCKALDALIDGMSDEELGIGT